MSLIFANWRKSSFSDTGWAGECVEVAMPVGEEFTGIRDTKNRGGLLSVPRSSWFDFIGSLTKS